jgi:putative hydrolase
VKLIFGAETSISDFDEQFDFPQNECAALDWIIASVHSDQIKQGTADDYTRLYLNIAENRMLMYRALRNSKISFLTMKSALKN